jgi:3-dehydroquinate synthase
MKKIIVKIIEKQKTYPIIIGEGILLQLEKLFDLKKYSKIFVLTDTQIEKSVLKNTNKFLLEEMHLIVVPSGERAKSIDTVTEIWKELLQQKADRKSLLINLGGGVIGDLGGFAASTYMRGIDFLQIPTTLLAMVDASIGGKTGVNFEETKNIVGTFNQPLGVVSDVDLLKSLSKRILTEGFGEIIKHGLIADKKYFEFVISKKPEEFSQKELATIIERSCKIKSEIFQKDPTENGIRKAVNFGHTIGHAIESLSQDTNIPLLHGEAVSIGIVAASYISHFKNMITVKDVERIKNALTNAGLPITFPGLKKEDVLEKMKSDKKTEKNIIMWTLLKRIGNAVVNEKVQNNLIEKALEEVLV